MNLIAENISHKYVQEELNKNIISTYKLQEMPNSFKGLHCIKGFQKEDLYILLKKIDYAHRRDPFEYRAQAPDLNISKYIELHKIKRINFILVGFFKMIDEAEPTLSLFNHIGERAKNRSYYININSIIDAYSNGKSSWYNSEGFKVNTVRSSLFFKELELRYHN